MRELSRVWFVLAGAGPDELDELAFALGARPIAALASAPDEASRAVARALARVLDLRSEELTGLAAPHALLLAALDDLAARHADLELVVCAPRPALRSALAHTLGLLPEQPAPLELRPGALVAFDWPTGLVEGVRPVLAGADLDWLPAWESGRDHGRYPGGPGAAGTSRG